MPSRLCQPIREQQSVLRKAPANLAPRPARRLAPARRHCRNPVPARAQHRTLHPGRSPEIEPQSGKPPQRHVPRQGAGLHPHSTRGRLRADWRICSRSLLARSFCRFADLRLRPRPAGSSPRELTNMVRRLYRPFFWRFRRGWPAFHLDEMEVEPGEGGESEVR